MKVEFREFKSCMDIELIPETLEEASRLVRFKRYIRKKKPGVFVHASLQTIKASITFELLAENHRDAFVPSSK